MESSLKSYQAGAKAVPAVFLLAEIVETVEVSGKFDAERQTWSNREYECAAMKKHNEAM